MAYGEASPNELYPHLGEGPCALAIAPGTYIGGWRVIRTLGKGLVELNPRRVWRQRWRPLPVILTSSHFGLALSTTHVATGSILGTGIAPRVREVRWDVAGRMVIAWFITLPPPPLWAPSPGCSATTLSGTMSCWALSSSLLSSATGGYIFYTSRKAPVNADNVNEEWDKNDPTQLSAAKAAKARKAHAASAHLPPSRQATPPPRPLPKRAPASPPNPFDPTDQQGGNR